MLLRTLSTTAKGLRKLIVLLLGVSVVLVGVIMLVTPGPAVVVIPAGMGLLATEFLWARRLLVRLRNGALDVAGKCSRKSQVDKEISSRE